MFIERYSRADSKAAKSAIVSEIIEVIRQADGNFCQLKKGKWFEVADHHAREKVSALLRDLLHTQYRSSAKAKIARRKTAKTEIRMQKKESGLDDTPHSDDSSTSSSIEIRKQKKQIQKMVDFTPHSVLSSTSSSTGMLKQNQSGQKMVNDTSHSDDSSMSSACWGDTNDCLEIDDLQEDKHFFDIEVF
jgi:hypothetical protein